MKSDELKSYIFEHIQIKYPQELYSVKQYEYTCCAEKLKFISLLMVYRCCKDNLWRSARKLCNVLFKQNCNMFLWLSRGPPKCTAFPWKPCPSVCKIHSHKFLCSFHICWATYRIWVHVNRVSLLTCSDLANNIACGCTLLWVVSVELCPWINQICAFCICRVRIKARQIHGTTHLVTRCFLLSQGEKKHLCFSYSVIILWFITYKSSECFILVQLSPYR